MYFWCHTMQRWGYAQGISVVNIFASRIKCSCSASIKQIFVRKIEMRNSQADITVTSSKYFSLQWFCAQMWIEYSWDALILFFFLSKSKYINIRVTWPMYRLEPEQWPHCLWQLQPDNPIFANVYGTAIIYSPLTWIPRCARLMHGAQLVSFFPPSPSIM